MMSMQRRIDVSLILARHHVPQMLGTYSLSPDIGGGGL